MTTITMVSNSFCMVSQSRERAHTRPPLREAEAAACLTVDEACEDDDGGLGGGGGGPGGGGGAGACAGADAGGGGLTGATGGGGTERGDDEVDAGRCVAASSAIHSCDE